MIVLVSLRMGCLTLSAIGAIGAGVVLGFAFRDRWRTPKPLVAISSQVGESAFNAEIARLSARRFVAEGAPADEPTVAYGVGWSRFVHRFDIGADECIAVVVAAREGHAAPKYAGLFNANSNVDQTFDQYAAQYNSQPVSANANWLYVASSEGLASTVTWCAHAPRSVEAHVMFRTIDGFSPPRRADATARWQVLRAPWASIGGPRGLHGPSVQQGALAALAAEFADPLGAAQREPPQGLSESAPSRDVPAGAAALLPVNNTTAIELYSLAARDSGIAVHPRVSAAHSADEQLAALAAFNSVAGGRALPAEHDAIVDLGRNDFYRVIAVVDATQFPATCTTVTLARGQGLFTPAVSRYSRTTRQRTALTISKDNVSTDRVCPTDGLFSYIVDDTDQQTYRVSQWGAAAPEPTTRGRRR